MRLSASQIQTFTDCQRKWGWRYLDGIEEPPNPAAEKGRAVHAALEQYLSGWQIDFTTEIGYIAASGLEHLPKPGTPGLLIEQEFHFEGPSGHTYLGYKDLEEPGIVTDHKTTSDLRWQKTAEELRDDIQATLYAVDYFRKHPEEPHVGLRWVYYQTKNTKKSAVTHIRVAQPETWQRFLEIERIAEQMHEVSQDKPDGTPVRALDLPANIDHCSAYGGCPHQGRCNLSPFDKMRSHVEQNKLTMLLKNRTNGATAAAPPAPVEHAFAPGGAHAGVIPTPPAAAPPATGNKLLASLQARGAPAAAAVVPAAINPPEFQPAPQPPAAAPAPRAEDTVLGATIADQKAKIAAASGELAESLAQGEPAAAEKRGRGRPSKATLPATGLAVKIEDPVPGLRPGRRRGHGRLAPRRAGQADHRAAERAGRLSLRRIRPRPWHARDLRGGPPRRTSRRPDRDAPGHDDARGRHHRHRAPGQGRAGGAVNEPKCVCGGPPHTTSCQYEPPAPARYEPPLHDDSALWHAVYAAAWVSDFRAARANGESFANALARDHAQAARRIANAAVAQLRRCAGCGGTKKVAEGPCPVCCGMLSE